MVLPHVISQREDSAPWTTTICQTMHRVAIAPITDHTPTKNARNVRCDITGRPARCWMWCAGSHDLTSPLRTRASHRFHHNLNLSPQRTSPPGSAGVAPACRVHRHCARIQRYTPSPLHRLGARASSPHAGCTGIAPAYSDTPHHPCTAWVRRCLARMPGARASRPHTAIRHLGMRASSPPPAICHVGAQASSPHAGSAGFQPASAICPAWVRRRPARMPGARASSPPTTPHLRARASSPPPAICHVGARASSPHAGCTGIAPAYSNTPHHPCTAWVRGLPARMPGAQALRPHTAIHPITPAPPGCAGVSPACWVRGLPARIPRYTTWVHRLPARLRRPTSEHGRPARIQ
jgi:hypothetical protein